MNPGEWKTCPTQNSVNEYSLCHNSEWPKSGNNPNFHQLINKQNVSFAYNSILLDDKKEY